MPKPNYQFQRRQRDLARRQKQEEKRLKKQAKREAAAGEAGETPAAGSTEQESA